MAYTILNTDGTVLLLLADGQVDKSATSLTLIGKNYESYGQDINNNFVKLLANFASTAGNPPRSPLKGQLWYDTTIKRLKVYDNGFKVVGGVTISSSQPSSLQTGDLWFDSSTNQLKLYSSGQIYQVGPSFPSTVGQNSWVLPTTTIKDQNSIGKQTLLLKSYGNTIAVAYFTATSAPFEMDNTDLQTYVPYATTSTIVSGITLIGDLSVSGKISNNYLSMGVDLSIIASGDDDALAFGDVWGTGAITIQNPAISNLLDKTFPPNATTATSTTTVMAGLSVGTQARIVCQYSTIGGVTTSGYQIRVFRTVGTYNDSSWQPYYYTTATVGSSIASVNFIQ
jgi:hypothetical protein